MAERRRIEGNFNQGWPVAIFITALAIGLFALAGYINHETYHDPIDPLRGPSSSTSTTLPPAAH